MDWNQVVEKVTAYIVKINTPTGNGTGFIYIYNENKIFAASLWLYMSLVTLMNGDSPFGSTTLV